MSHARRVAKNSFWLIAQPLILNIISLFVVGYVARTLGQGDYGRFTFAFTYIALFMPLTSVGLGSLTTRAIAENRENSSIFLGKMLFLRTTLAVVVFFVAVSVSFIGSYEPSTRLLMILASTTIVFNTMSGTLHSAFQGFEKMEYVALTQFIAGVSLISLSVFVLYIGGGVLGLTIVYVFSSVLSIIVSTWQMLKRVIVPRITFDYTFFITLLRKGLPFFVPGVMTIINTRFGMIMLQKMSGDSAVGIYGAAYNLVDRLLVVPEGICAAIFPAIAVLYISKPLEAIELFKRYFQYLLILVTPIAIGGILLAEHIITLIYGSNYIESVPVLRVMLIWLFFTFLSSILGWVLASIHREKQNAMVPVVITPIYLILNYLLIPKLSSLGVAWATCITAAVSCLTLYFFISRYFVTSLISVRMLGSLIASNLVMVAGVLLIRDLTLFGSIAVGAILYFGCGIILHLFSRSDVISLLAIIKKKLPGTTRIVEMEPK